jgi:hypothetical protein
MSELHRDLALDHAVRVLTDLAELFPTLAAVDVLALVVERIERP